MRRADIDAWTADDFERSIPTLDEHYDLERARWTAQSRAYRSAASPDTCRRWAALSLAANARMWDDTPSGRANRWHTDFALRTWVLVHVGPGEDPVWDPRVLASDTLAALVLDPDDAAASSTWRELPLERIRELRRHKNLTAHLGVLLPHLPDGPVKERLTAWQDVRAQLP